MESIIESNDGEEDAPMIEEQMQASFGFPALASAEQPRAHDLSILSAIKGDADSQGNGLMDSLLEDDGGAALLDLSEMRPNKSPHQFKDGSLLPK